MVCCKKYEESWTENFIYCAVAYAFLTVNISWPLLFSELFWHISYTDIEISGSCLGQGWQLRVNFMSKNGIIHLYSLILKKWVTSLCMWTIVHYRGMKHSLKPSGARTILAIIQNLHVTLKNVEVCKTKQPWALI